MKTELKLIGICLQLSVICLSAFAQGSAITYQGQLQNNGSPTSGNYNMTFTLFNSSSGGSAVAGPVFTNGVIVSNGLFTVPIDFGPGMFTGQTDWLEISMETNLAGNFMTLTPRQEFTPTPYAVYAETAGNATVLANGAAIGAGLGNSISTSGATDAFIGGGTVNSILFNSLYATIGGGQNNSIKGNAGLAVIGGGQNNQTASGWSVIGGGNGNVIGSGTLGSTISGGYNNTNNGNYATVPGGNNNLAGGQYSLAAGQQAKAIHQGAFVWADSQPAAFASTAPDSFNVRAKGGVQFVTAGAGVTVDGQPVAKSYGTPISSAPYNITQPGSYYMTTNLTVTTGDAIDINANGVTLDLNGFTISSTAPNATGNAIYLALANGNTDISIVNGHIVSGVTNNPNTGIFNGPGFLNGIEFNNKSPFNIHISGISVSGCQGNGIDVIGQTFLVFYGDDTVVDSCTVNTAGGNGITGGSLSHCTANECGGNGIEANHASDCSGNSTGGVGLNAVTANNCFGYSSAGSSGTGISAGVAIGCFGFCESGIGISAQIGNSCIIQNGTDNIQYKYNMP